MKGLIINRLIRTSQKGFTLVELMIATVIFSTILLLLSFGLLNIGQSYYKGKNSARTQDIARRVIDEISNSIRYGDTPPGPVALVGASPPYQEVIRGEANIAKSDNDGNFISNIAPGPGVSHDFSDYNPTNFTIQDYFCIGSKRYSFGNKRVRKDEGAGRPEQHGLVVDTVSSCDNAGAGLGGPLATGRKELLAENTRLTEFKIIKNGLNYTIIVQVSTGDDELLVLKKPVNPGDSPFGTCKPGPSRQYCAVSRLETTVQRRLNN